MQIRLDLEAKLRELTGKVRQGTRELREASAKGPVTDSDIDELDSGENTTEFLTVRARAIKEVEAALARIDEGKYGMCRDCEEPISPKRLMIVPTAILCVDCQRTEERLGPRNHSMREIVDSMESGSDDESR